MGGVKREMEKYEGRAQEIVNDSGDTYHTEKKNTPEGVKLYYLVLALKSRKCFSKNKHNMFSSGYDQAPMRVASIESNALVG